MSRFKKATKVEAQESPTSADNDYMNFVIDDVKPIPSKTDSKLSQPLGKRKINELMTDSIIDGLETAIPKSSKGYQLLEKFGYKSEGGLGKNEQGQHEPLQLNTYNLAKKSGIGNAPSSSTKPIISTKMKQKHLQTLFNQDINTYRHHTTNILSYKKLIKDIKQAQRVLMELDEKHGAEWHELWPIDKEQSTSIADTDTVIDKEKELYYTEEAAVLDTDGDGDILESVSDRNLIPPGHTGQIDEAVDTDKLQQVDSEETMLQQQLTDCLTYLRDTYNYCLYCGCAYDSAADLRDNCPGVYSDDH